MALLSLRKWRTLYFITLISAQPFTLIIRWWRVRLLADGSC